MNPWVDFALKYGLSAALLAVILKWGWPAFQKFVSDLRKDLEAERRENTEGRAALATANAAMIAMATKMGTDITQALMESNSRAADLAFQMAQANAFQARQNEIQAEVARQLGVVAQTTQVMADVLGIKPVDVKRVSRRKV